MLLYDPCMCLEQFWGVTYWNPSIAIGGTQFKRLWCTCSNIDWWPWLSDACCLQAGVYEFVVLALVVDAVVWVRLEELFNDLKLFFEFRDRLGKLDPKIDNVLSLASADT